MNHHSYHQYHKLPRTIDDRDKIASIIASLIREEHASVWNRVSELSISNSKDLQNLFSHGIIRCGLNRDFLSKLLNKFQFFEKFNEKNKRTCDITNLLNINDIYPLLLDTSLLCLVSSYLGAPARLQKFTLSWSNIGQSPEALNPQKFHRDRDDFRTLQLFIYLTNVDEIHGPHQYVPKTHNLEILKSTYNENIISNGLNHRFLTQDELNEVLGTEKPKILTLTGPKGSAFLEDTGGFHRGTVPKSADSSRLMLGITWSLAKGTGFVNVGRDQVSAMVNKFNQFPEKLNEIQKYSLWLN